jgi:uncharacterized membrane protein HdeD (DUF308 family)
MSEMSPGKGGAVNQVAKRWWLFLITGIAWLIISLVVLQFNLKSVYAVGLMTGLVILAAAVNEFIVFSQVDSWRWFHFILGILFALTGIACLFYPGRTFITVASIFGWFLLFKGTFDIIGSLELKAEHELWWLQLIIGILEIALAFWAVGYWRGSAYLVIVWVGIAAMMRGITEIVTAFSLRKVKKEYAAA